MALAMIIENKQRDTDEVILTLADYVANHHIQSDLAYNTARYCLMDSIGCALLALQYPACTKLLGPIIPGTHVPIGAKVPGTNYYLDPILAAFNIGAMIRWLDFNDTWLAAEWGHPSDNLGAILATAEYMSRKRIQENKEPLRIKDVLTALIKAQEIQGVLALENSFNRVGIDHVILVKIASSAIAAQLLGGNQQQITDAITQAFVDGGTLRTYRHAPNAGPRKSWAAGDATSRGLRFAWMTLQGEMGYPSVLTTPRWGFNDVVMHGQSLTMPRKLDSYVMEHILFKIAFPAEFHAQTAVESAFKLHPEVVNRLDEIEKIVLTTHESAMRIISKTGPLNNPAARDHCLQYMVAVALLHGNLTADYYEDSFAKDPRIDQLRNKMLVQEDKQYSQDYLDPDKRSIANAIQIYFKDGSKTEKVVVEYPIGHKRRREEGIPLMFKKFENAAKPHYSAERFAMIVELFRHQDKLEQYSVDAFMDLLAKE